MGAEQVVTRPRRPPAPYWENFPPELTTLNQWVNWRYEIRDDRPTKVPYQPNGSAASATDRATWSSFEHVQIAYETRFFDGVGFVLTSGDPFAAFDFDHCIDREAGTITDPKIAGHVGQLDSYTEITPSGTGLRVIVRAKLPAQDRKFGNCECYDNMRFVTITGRVYEF